MITRELKEYYIRTSHPHLGCGTPVLMAMLVSVVLLLSSCATRTKIEYRDRDVHHYITQVQHDTIIDKSTDSVYYEVKVKGDTVYATKYKEVTRWKERVVEKHDTCWRDSIVTEYKESVKEVKKIPKIYTYSLIFSILVIIFAVVKILRWLRVF